MKKFEKQLYNLINEKYLGENEEQKMTPQDRNSFLEAVANFHKLGEMVYSNARLQQVTETLKKAIKYTQHIQISNVPNRSEPNIGELNYNYIIKYIDKLHYKGLIGCEYHPQKETLKGLEWLDDYS